MLTNWQAPKNSLMKVTSSGSFRGDGLAESHPRAQAPATSAIRGNTFN